MPVRIRLATNGAARNWTMTENSTLFPRRRLDGVDQHGDVRLEQLQKIARRGNAAVRWRQNQHLAAGLRGDRVRRLRIEVGLDDDHLDLLSPHLLDHVERVLRRRWNAGLGLDVADD